MEKRNILIIVFLLIVTITLSLLVLKSAPLALASLLGIILLTTIFFYPYFGLVLYLVLLFIRPQDFIPSLAPLRIMLTLAIIINKEEVMCRNISKHTRAENRIHPIQRISQE
jgi:hypothetical protein